MLECISFNSLTPSPSNLPPPPPPPPHSQGNSTEEEEDTPITSPNVSHEYDLAVQTHSYNEIRSMVLAPPQPDLIVQENETDQDSHHRHVLTQVLQPDPDSVREALATAKPTSATVTRLVSSYFDHSQNASHLCLLLCGSIHRARQIYAPLSDLIGILDPSSSLSQPQCDRAYDLFLQFDRHENPFLFPHFQDLRRSFSNLRSHIQLDRRKCRSRIRLLRRATAGCAVCLVATTAAAVVSAALFAVHAAVGFAAVALTPFCVPKSERKVRERLKQLDAAENGTLVAKDIDTIDSLVDRLQTAVEGDKAHVRFALERGKDRHATQEVVKQLRKTQLVLEQLLNDLEQHIYLCFSTVNKARRCLLREISLHQTL
ncbi:UPF0496 protein At3g19330-like [Lotus japonicus]|uniref:UPF0496 protein At3g19330-like n=1 Tax=Lotus japonicus TaxID=34305 RepID=UPI00258D9CFC|nr:UPF0496 protein At3g19330-like [Lotus japonicus]